MRRLLILAAVVLGSSACVVLSAPRYYSGPVSDHFDGERFFDPANEAGKSLWEVLKWRLTAERAEWPESVPLAQRAKPEARVGADQLRVTFVGHATVLIQVAGLNVLIDPIWSERASPFASWGPRRVTEPGIAFEDLPPIDLVLVSHSHYDHMDLPTLSRLRAVHDPLFVLPLGNDAVVHAKDPALRTATLDWWQPLEYGDDFMVHAVPVYHWSRRGLLDRNRALWAGFVLETPLGKIYYGGDTGFGPDGAYFREAGERFGGFTLALLPVGAYEPRWFMQAQHVNPDEAVRMHRLLKAQTSIGVHLRTFQLTDEGIDQPDVELQAALKAQQIEPARFCTLPIGGEWRAPE